MSVAVDINVEFELGTDWTDVYDDVMVTPVLKGRYGSFGQKPTSRVASPGSLDLVLDNSPANSGGLEGYYTPGHANVRSGFTNGIGCRVTFTYARDTFYKWQGRIKKIDPEAGTWGPLTVKVRAIDWMGDAAKLKPEGIETQANAKGEALLSHALTKLTNQPNDTDFGTGQSTFAYAFDEVRDRQTTMHQILKNVAYSELGFIWVSGDSDKGGVLRWRDRHSRVTTTDVLIEMVGTGTDSDSFDFIDVEDNRNSIFNNFRVTAFPRTVDSDVIDSDVGIGVMWELQGDDITVPAGQTVILYGNYTDPENPGVRIGGLNMASVTSDDWSWSGNDSDLAIVDTLGGNSARFAITNNGAASGDLTKLQVRGKRVLVYQPAVVEAYDSDSIDDYEDRPFNLRLPYQNKTTEAQDFADILLGWYKDAIVRVKSVTFSPNRNDGMMKAFLRGEPGSKIKITEPIANIDEEFFINGVQFKVMAGSVVKATWYLEPASTAAYWILGTSKLDTETLLGF
jgi:hypothetical protein